MSRKALSRGFTLIELLVVVAIIAVLMSILLPSLQRAREQGKMAKCLSNMRNIGQATHSYSTEDEYEQAVPITPQATSTIHAQGFGGEWGWRTASPFMIGGPTPSRDFPGRSPGMDDPEGPWAAPHRPLNRYMFTTGVDAYDKNAAELFRCPSDKGFFEPGSVFTLQDAPPEVIGVPCWDYLGNSYRIAVQGLVFLSSTAQAAGYVSVGPWGHRASTLQETGKLVMYAEPMFYNMSRQNDLVDDVDSLPTHGWHGVRMTDNVVYGDGSARPTKVDSYAEWPSDTLNSMNYTPDFDTNAFLRRGSTWRMDCYPTPAALIKVRRDNGAWFLNEQDIALYSGWPFDGLQVNSH